MKIEINSKDVNVKLEMEVNELIELVDEFNISKEINKEDIDVTQLGDNISSHIFGMPNDKDELNDMINKIENQLDDKLREYWRRNNK